MKPELHYIFSGLNREFRPEQVHTRAGGGGRQLSYITERLASIRLDEILLPHNWRSSYRVERLSDGSEAVVCKLELRIQGEWIAKEGAGGFKIMTERDKTGKTVEDEENTVKTGFSDAFKRAAAAWGVARYLYQDGIPEFPAPEPFPNRVEAPRQPQRYDPDAQVEPYDDGCGQADAAPQPQQQAQAPNDNWVPKDGRDLWNWAKDLDAQQNLGLVKYLTLYGRQQMLSDRMVTWPQKPARDAYRAAIHWLNTPQPAAPSRRNGRR